MAPHLRGTAGALLSARARVPDFDASDGAWRWQARRYACCWCVYMFYFISCLSHAELSYMLAQDLTQASPPCEIEVIHILYSQISLAPPRPRARLRGRRSFR
jgi:hypothetical protein